MSFISFSCFVKTFWSLVCTSIYHIGAVKSTLTDAFFIRPVLFCRKMEKTRPMNGEMYREVLFSHRIRYFSFVNVMVRVLFLVCTSTWRVNYYVSCQGQCINWRNESTVPLKNRNLILLKWQSRFPPHFSKVVDFENIFLLKRRVKFLLRITFHLKIKE